MITGGGGHKGFAGCVFERARECVCVSVCERHGTHVNIGVFTILVRSWHLSLIHFLPQQLSSPDAGFDFFHVYTSS